MLKHFLDRKDFDLLKTVVQILKSLLLRVLKFDHFLEVEEWLASDELINYACECPNVRFFP